MDQLGLISHKSNNYFWLCATLTSWNRSWRNDSFVLVCSQWAEGFLTSSDHLALGDRRVLFLFNTELLLQITNLKRQDNSCPFPLFKPPLCTSPHSHLCHHECHLVLLVRSPAVLTQLEWICTHPIPRHAHTHFLAGFGAALILNAAQAVTAPTPVAIRILQDLHHTSLVDGVNALVRITHRNDKQTHVL